MYHFKIKADPAFAWGVPELVHEIKPEGHPEDGTVPRSQAKQALILAPSLASSKRADLTDPLRRPCGGQRRQLQLSHPAR